MNRAEGSLIATSARRVLEQWLAGVLVGLTLVVLAATFWDRDTGADASRSEEDEPIPSPDPLDRSTQAALDELATTEILQRTGLVAGQQTPASPTFVLAGSQCTEPSATLTAALDGRFRDVEFVGAVDDSSPDGSRVRVQVFGDADLLTDTIVDHGTSGVAVKAAVDGVDRLDVVMTALTRSDECAIEDHQVHLMNGVAR